MSRSNTLCNQKEIVFPEGEQLVSTTDLKGVITYCNPSFCRVAGYCENELLGQNHNIIRHQDMPKAAFADLWARLREGKAWRGIVKNKAKSGDYYWVDAYVTPIYENGKITGYQSVRVKPKAHWVKIATTAYQQLLKAEKRGRRAAFALPDSLKYTALATACALPAISNLLDGGFNMQAALSLTPVAVIGLLFRQELFDTPIRLKELRQRYDSISRLIFSGSDRFSVADYHLKMASARIRTVLGRMTDSAAPLHDLADQLSDSATKVNKAISVQNRNIQHVADAMEDISDSARSVASHTVQSNSLLNETRDHCRQTRIQLDSTQHSLHDLSSQAEQATEATRQLSSEANKVSTVMNEIRGIAEQTNLLALNAAIEAARAGENGRGFAVVADEVRALSSRTQNATEQIQSSISQMVTTIDEWQALIESNRDKTNECVDIAEKGAECLQQVESNMQSINELISEVSTSASQQEQLSEQTNQHIHAIAEASQQNLQEVAQVEQSSSTLKKRVDDFHQLAARFEEK
ncbi:Methyl-accepting chemotaxis protein [Photobacterium marinum]|uniref:Methyl-accepting chemotaxis protein n=1 Tax=Photobacterium marinum TaxID=1056511 RepID=L8JB94_9GAMM|nr:PAS domain-containing methyl-accepting chemotaxis protein [Photobacterium marinum]ELR66081.1 Methyl-accepting chemotaxis protein [Photobacterium marinum]